jgi:hypothetical protein
LIGKEDHAEPEQGLVGLLWASGEARTGTADIEPAARSWGSRPITSYLWPAECARTASVESGQEPSRRVSKRRAPGPRAERRSPILCDQVTCPYHGSRRADFPVRARWMVSGFVAPSSGDGGGFGEGAFTIVLLRRGPARGGRPVTTRARQADRGWGGIAGQVPSRLRNFRMSRKCGLVRIGRNAVKAEP